MAMRTTRPESACLIRRYGWRLVAGLALNLSVGGAAEPPALPIGLDAYRQWDHWAYQRIGERAYMRSTYDRTGGNEGADASHFLYQLSDTNNVTLDVAGPGMLYFVRYNHWHGSPWHYVVDGLDHVIQETSTANPNQPTAGSQFIPAEAFPSPLAVTWSTTKGADLSWVPIGFEKSFRMEYSRTHYGTGYYIYHQFVDGTRFSAPLKSWDAGPPRDRAVLELIASAGTDIAPTNGVTELRGTLPEIRAGEKQLVILVTNSPASIRKLSFSVPPVEALAFGRTRLRVTWDERAEASVDVPMSLFFGAGVLYNRDGREYLVKAFPVSIRYSPQAVSLACYFPMPFFRSARLELVGGPALAVSNIEWSARCQALRAPRGDVGYFHATYRDHPKPQAGRDLLLLDTRGIEGSPDWSGSFVGTSFIFSDRAELGTLEGDPRFFFDDSESPQAQGTGTEEWCGGGDYWGGRNMTLAFVGHPTGARNAREARNEEDRIESAYRFLLADLMPFGKRAVIQLEHGGRDESTEHYQTVTYWYGAPRACLVKTDELKIGDTDSEARHAYVSPQAGAPYEITSRYEWGGDDSVPVQTDRGRKTTGTSEFTLKLDPRNVGVLLRRKLDYSFPNQRAEVFVAVSENDWKSAGLWYLAGASTCVYSNPKDELGPAQHIVETSNRRFRDDEFLLPRNLTEGRSSIRIRIQFIPVRIPLYPGYPLAEQAWSEIRYDAYCYVRSISF